MVTYVTLLERKFAARMQSRIGPYYVGPHGLLQPIADAIKLMLKEDVVPTTADRWVYNLAPIAFLVPCVLIFATLPFAPGLGLVDLNIGLLFFLAVSSLEIVGLFMGGWASNNKYALLSAMRGVNQIISYDLPFILASLVPVVLGGWWPGTGWPGALAFLLKAAVIFLLVTWVRWSFVRIRVDQILALSWKLLLPLTLLLLMTAALIVAMGGGVSVP